MRRWLCKLGIHWGPWAEAPERMQRVSWQTLHVQTCSGCGERLDECVWMR